MEGVVEQFELESYSEKQTNEMKWKRNKEQQIKEMWGTGRKKDWKRGERKRDLMFRLPINDHVSNLLAPLVEIATSSLP
jgi:hypothetical protein